MVKKRGIPKIKVIPSKIKIIEKKDHKKEESLEEVASGSISELARGSKGGIIAPILKSESPQDSPPAPISIPRTRPSEDNTSRVPYGIFPRTIRSSEEAKHYEAQRDPNALTRPILKSNGAIQNNFFSQNSELARMRASQNHEEDKYKDKFRAESPGFRRKKVWEE